MPRLETPLIVLVVLLVTAVPAFFGGIVGDAELPHTTWQSVAFAGLVVSGLSLALWRRYPALVLVTGTASILGCAVTGLELSSAEAIVLPTLMFLAAYSWGGRTAFVVGLGLVVWMEALYLATGEDGPALLIFSLPGYVAGVVLRRFQETAAQLELRSRELEEERELFAALSVRNERSRIAAELHDIIGHALSVMVVQAAAAQRLVGSDAAVTSEAFAVVAESARQGREDLSRLVDLLDGEAVVTPDLSLIDEVVTSATRSGLAVTCRFEGDRDSIPAPFAHAMFRVVQEGLTNALRYAPGAAVRVLVRCAGDGVTVSVVNDRPAAASPEIVGTGHGLQGLRERIQRLGGALAAGAAPNGGWALEASLPLR